MITGCAFRPEPIPQAGPAARALPFRRPAGSCAPAPLAVAGLCGLLTMLVFALWPLAAIGQVSPASLFRDRVAPAPRGFAPLAATASAAAALVLAALIVLTATDRKIALWYVGGAF